MTEANASSPAERSTGRCRAGAPVRACSRPEAKVGIRRIEVARIKLAARFTTANSQCIFVCMFATLRLRARSSELARNARAEASRSRNPAQLLATSCGGLPPGV